MKATEKYLASYAEKEAACLNNLPGRYSNGLVIPVYQENSDFLNRLLPLFSSEKCHLLVLVINTPDSNTDCQWAMQLTQYFASECTLLWQDYEHALRLWRFGSGAVLTVDRCIEGEAIPADQGVGLARKIGADILCQLIHNGSVVSPWIANTDADAILPSLFFDKLSSQANRNRQESRAAIIFPFTHTGDHSDTLTATAIYEFSLNYYVAGLKWAESPYAYHTLGSTLNCHYQHYAQVRGFPKRAGAEDFYLLNKLAKTGEIQSLCSPLVTLQARQSTRVPFGTGPAVANLLELDTPTNKTIYHPESFRYLKFFIALLNVLCEKSDNLHAAACALAVKIDPDIKVQIIEHLASELAVDAALMHCFRHGKTTAVRHRQMSHWFDSFKTLKAIHFLRDNYFPLITVQHWVEHSKDYRFGNYGPSLNLPTAVETG